MDPARWLRMAGLLTWAVCGLPGIVVLAGGRLGGPLAVAWAVAFAAFGVAFWLNTNGRRRSIATSVALLLIQSVAGLALVAVTHWGQEAAGLVVVAAQVPHTLSTRGAVAWVAIQTALLSALFWRISGPAAAIAAGGAFAGFQVFAVTTAWLARNEQMARMALDRTLAELQATRELLAQNTRIAERLRISRDLHDTLGHHLTGLILQLDLAARQTDGAAGDRIREAHAITRLLLSDVRDAVTELRHDSRVELTHALRTLAPRAGTPVVHLDLPERLDVEDPAHGETILRCVQELITNAAKHSAAGHLWIEIEQRPEGVEVRARDDGRGAAAVRWGHGLTGMRERFEALAGRVDVHAAEGTGFEVRAFLPRREAVA